MNYSHSLFLVESAPFSRMQLQRRLLLLLNVTKHDVDVEKQHAWSCVKPYIAHSLAGPLAEVGHVSGVSSPRPSPAPLGGHMEHLLPPQRGVLRTQKQP